MLYAIPGLDPLAPEPYLNSLSLPYIHHQNYLYLLIHLLLLILHQKMSLLWHHYLEMGILLLCIILQIILWTFLFSPLNQLLEYPK